MPNRVPSSRAYFRVKISAVDGFSALVAPLLALSLRDAPVLSEGSYALYFYCACTALFSLISFNVFRLHGNGRFFSVDDIFDIVKAVAVTEVLAAIALFSFTRLDGIPRSTLFIHALILAIALIATRTAAHLFNHEQKKAIRRPPQTKHVVLIGSNFFTGAFIKWMETNEVDPKQVVAILDESEEMIGRKVSGVPVLARPSEISRTIEEFAIHGVKIDEVIVSNGDSNMAKPLLMELRKACGQHNIELNLLPQILHSLLAQNKSNVEYIQPGQAQTIPVSRYFMIKRPLDIIFSLALIVVALPLFAAASALVILDVGTPILFWQRRLGQGGRGFQIYKFRTMQTPFDRFGDTLPENRRLSLVGHLLRRTGLDELPQLLNVLVGDMSLIGPRPLLPQDQPENPTNRLLVRPGITGWAQVNGGKQITSDEKDSLDEWYIRNASLSLDLRILLLTVRYVFLGNPAIERNVAEATRAAEDARRDSSRPPSDSYNEVA